MTLLAKAYGLYRFTAGYVASWSERAVQEQDALEALRTSPGFQALQDVLDSEERALFGKWRSLPAGDMAVMDLHAEAQAFNRLSRVIRQATHGKIDAEAAEAELKRQMDLRKVDGARNADVAERLREHTLRTRDIASRLQGAGR